MIQIQAYQCEYCGKTHALKAQISRHEKHHCRKSPLAARCDGCVYLDFSETETIDDKYKAICEKGHDLYEVVDIENFDPYLVKSFRKHCQDWEGK